MSFHLTLAPVGADGPYTHGVVAADAAPCSVVGRDILKKNGSAVDSAIAALFCIGIINMHSAGIGGGGFMTVYNRSLGLAKVYDFREVAPGNASANMYVNSSLSSKLGEIYRFCSFWRNPPTLSQNEEIIFTHNSLFITSLRFRFENAYS